jgi:hypothetical protein
MRAFALSLFATAIVSLPLSAQEGHPVKGSWIGVWEGNETHGDDVLVIMDWDGREISGVINPGTDNIEITEATLDPDGWVLSIEARGENDDGDEITYTIEGSIMDLELPNRYIVGTWRSNEGRGDFEIRRQ